MKTIDLSKHHTAGTIVLSGRPKGEALRKTLNLDKLDTAGEEVRVVVPNEVVSLNSSFFAGLFGPSVRALGDDGFRRKYSFESIQEIRQDVESGIRDALKTSNPLDKSISR